MDAEVVFDAFDKLSDAVHRADEVRKLRTRIFDAERKRCGSCERWMKTGQGKKICEPEKNRGIFRSCGALACSLFEWKQWDLDFIDELKKELKSLTKGGA